MKEGVSDLNTFAQKGSQIVAAKKLFFTDIFAFLHFVQTCYYSHWLREALSPVCGIFLFDTVVELVGGGSFINRATALHK